MTSDPKILGLAFISGIIPSLLWLWFWLREDKKNPEPKGLLTIIFIMGMVAVFFVIPIQKYIQMHTGSHEWQLIFWAAAEEMIKFIAVGIILWGTDIAEEPIDWPIYMITAALGFAALENMLFLAKPFSVGATAVGLLTGQLRYLGATLLHTVASAMVGIGMGLSLHMNFFIRKTYFIIGLVFAVALHSVFNFFIMKNSGGDFLKVFAFLWVVTIIVLLLFEKIRRMN